MSQRILRHADRDAIWHNPVRLTAADLPWLGPSVPPSDHPVTFHPFEDGDDLSRAVSANNGYDPEYHYPGVAAFKGDDLVGHLEWHGPKSPQPNEVAMIKVHPDHKRQGIGSALFDWAKKNVNPDLHHSPLQTGEGRGWSQKMGAQVIPFPGHYNTESPVEEEHDWTQHGLGDPEDWEEENRFRHFDAALDAQGSHQFPGMDQLSPTGEDTGSSHSGTEKYTHPSTGENWLIKTPPANQSFLAHGDVAASAIQQYSGLKTPPTFLTDNGGTPASAQLMFHAKDAFPGKNFDPEKLSAPDLMTIQKHHALDWLIGNHDAHANQFIRDDDGDLVGIDKGQAFKHYAQDRLHWNYHPNSAYGEHEPVYNTLYRNFAQGGRQLNDPRTGELGQFISHLQDTPGDEFLQTLKPYADAAVERGSLGKQHGGYNGHAPARFKPNSSLFFLEHALNRKNSLMQDFGDLYDRAMAHRMTGTKIARHLHAAPPSEHEMHSEDEALGTNQRAHVYTDPQGQWIIKPPPSGHEYMVPLEVGTAALQKRVGLETPETHAIPFQGGLAVASKRYPNATQAFGGQSGREPISHNQLSPGDLQTLQKHQALDWLIGNHDAHVGNWLRTQEGNLVGIDKGQAMKYFGQDRLDPTFHPNYYAREPVYNRLWRQHARGKGEMADPRQGSVGEFVNRLQSIPDDELKGMFAPYAHAAAQAGRLATGGEPDPDRKLSPRSVPPNDPHAFLDALVARKNNLHNDLGALYDKTTKARAQAQRAQSQQITPGLDPQSFGTHESARYAAPDAPPAPPKPPTAPTAPGTSPTTTPGATPPAPATTLAPGSTNTPGASPLSYTMPQGDQSARKGPAISQHPWDALGIPVGIPSTYQHTQDQLRQQNPNSTNLNHPTNIQGDPYGNGAGTSSPGGGGAGGSTPSTSNPSTTSQGGPGTPTNYNPSSGVEQWRPHVEEGLRRNGLPVTPDYVNRVLHQMQTESSGNPKAINNSDSNAAAGTPSKGLLQTIDPTFQSHHLPGDANDPYDPQANIDAAINYAKGRYGPTLMDSSGNGMGSGHGY